VKLWVIRSGPARRMGLYLASDCPAMIRWSEHQQNARLYRTRFAAEELAREKGWRPRLDVRVVKLRRRP